MNFVLLIFFFMIGMLQANPFLPALELKQGPAEFYFTQTPSFKYPFIQSASLDAFEVNLEKFSQLLGSEKLNAYADTFKNFKYDQKLNLYGYDFNVGEQWEFLPHPFIRDVSAINSSDWVSEFDRKLPVDEGVNSVEFLQSIDALTDSEAYAGNSVQVLKTPLNFQTILSRIRTAKDHIFMSSFIFQCDGGSSEILSLMEKKIKEGVDIYLLIDRVFTLADRGCVNKLKSIGVNLRLVGSLLKIFHEKMFVFDGEYAVVDGQNMTGIQTLSNGSNNLINDMGIGIEGPLVQEVAHRFIAHWKKAKRKKLPQRLSDFYAQKKSQAESFKSQEAIKEGINKKTGVCRLVTSDPGFKKRAILPMYFSYVQSAQNYLFFNQIDHRFQDVSGNSVGKSFLKEVIKAANGNKDLRVDMLTNQWKLPTEIKLPEGMGVKPTFFSFMISKPGKLIIEMPHLQIGTARENLLPLIEKNNFHWWASAIYMHAKTMMVDNIATFIGSYNINRGSENFSYEQVVVCHDEKLAQSMQKSIVQDLLNSIPIPIQKEN